MFYYEKIDLLISIRLDSLLELLNSQLKNNFLINNKEHKILELTLENVLIKCKECFEPNLNKYFSFNKKVFFNPYHSSQYSIFLYYLSREIYLLKNNTDTFLLADKIYCLNKMMNSVDLFYEVELPKVFTTEHPLGSIIGKAQYDNGFAFSQNCTVGSNKQDYPIIGKNVWMLSGSKILGKSKIGNNVIISANTYIKDLEVPNYTIVFGAPNNYSYKKLSRDYMNNNFKFFKV